MKGYDAWKLDTGESEEEIYESELETYYSSDKLKLLHFELEVEKLAEEHGLVTKEDDI